MRKTLLSALVAGAFSVSGAIAAPLTFDLNGASVAGGVITATALDWTTTSFLALGGNLAITNKVLNGFDNGTRSTTFDVLTHAKLIGYTDQFGVAQSLPGFGGEITVVARFTEIVSSATPALGFAQFATTGAGWVEMYYSAPANSAALTGSGFTDGTLIMRGTGVDSAAGSFLNTGRIERLDQFDDGISPVNDYGTQMTVTGTGSQESIKFGSGGFALDSNFLKTSISDFSILFTSISIGLPFNTVDPSDCFNPNQSASTNADINNSLAAGQSSQCQANHTTGTYAANFAANGNDGGYVPVVGGTNGAFRDSPDFVALTDFNSAVSGTVPEPGMLALLGLAFAGLGVTTMRRRRA